MRKSVTKEKLHRHVFCVIESSLPRPDVRTAPIEDALKRPDVVADEIAGRVVANFNVVGRRGLRDQILIVLADYRDHSWTFGKLKSEATRMRIADQIMGVFAEAR